MTDPADIRIQRGMATYMKNSSGACHIEVREADDLDKATEGLRAFRDDLFSSDLFDVLDGEFGPDTNGTPLRYTPSYAATVEADGEKAAFWFDADDVLETWPELVKELLRRLQERLREAGVKRAQIGWPKPPYTYDPEADWFHGAAKTLQPLSDQWLPPGFPQDLAVPGNSGIAVAHESRAGNWSHAAWKRRRLGEQFADVLEAWRNQGFTVEPMSGPPEPPDDLRTSPWFQWFPADHWFRMIRTDGEAHGWIHGKELKRATYLHLLWYPGGVQRSAGQGRKTLSRAALARLLTRGVGQRSCR